MEKVRHIFQVEILEIGNFKQGGFMENENMLESIEICEIDTCSFAKIGETQVRKRDNGFW